MVGSDCSETSSHEGTLDSQDFDETSDSEFASTPEFDDDDHADSDYWDTIDGMPPAGFSSQHGFMISHDNCIGIIPCTETLSRFKPYLTRDEHYDVLLQTCDELGHTFYIEPVYETMYTDDVVCYFEEYLPNFDDYPSLHWVAPSAQFNCLVDIGNVGDVPGCGLAQHFYQATYAFVTVHDEGDSENATPDKRHRLLKPNNRFMAAFVCNYREAGFDLPDSALTPAILRRIPAQASDADDADADADADDANDNDADDADNANADDADDTDIESAAVAATGTAKQPQARSCVPEATGDSTPCATTSPPLAASKQSELVRTELVTFSRQVSGPATSQPSNATGDPAASVDATSTAVAPFTTVKRKASAELLDEDEAKKAKV